MRILFAADHGAGYCVTKAYHVIGGAVVQVLQDPAVRQRFQSDGAEPAPSRSPDDFRQFMRAESRKWAKVVKDARLQPD